MIQKKKKIDVKNSSKLAGEDSLVVGVTPNNNSDNCVEQENSVIDLDNKGLEAKWEKTIARREKVIELLKKHKCIDLLKLGRAETIFLDKAGAEIAIKALGYKIEFGEMITDVKENFIYAKVVCKLYKKNKFAEPYVVYNRDGTATVIRDKEGYVLYRYNWECVGQGVGIATSFDSTISNKIVNNEPMSVAYLVYTRAPIRALRQALRQAEGLNVEQDKELVSVINETKNKAKAKKDKAHIVDNILYLIKERITAKDGKKLYPKTFEWFNNQCLQHQLAPVIESLDEIKATLVVQTTQRLESFYNTLFSVDERKENK